jgi:DNA-binding NarL/FixJ family response regulator
MRVVIADDAVLFRQGVARLLGDAGYTTVGQAGDADQLLDLVVRRAPDVALVDVRMPPTRTTEGLAAAVRIRTEHPQVAVLVLSQYVEPHYALRVLGDGSGHAGYLLKDRIADIGARRCGPADRGRAPGRRSRRRRRAAVPTGDPRPAGRALGAGT